MKQELFIVGAGGHGKVVLDAALLQDKYRVAGLVDDNLAPGTTVNGMKVITDRAGIGKTFSAGTAFIVAIGNNALREEICNELRTNYTPATIIHPSCIIANTAIVGEGTVVLAGAVINANAMIGNNCIINSLSLIDHDTRIGNHTHIAQGTIVGSHVTIPAKHTSELGGRYPSYTNY